MPDPILKEAMKEIVATCKKYDCAAMVTLASEKHVEFLYEISPSWSCAWIQPLPDGEFGIRIRSKLKDYPSKEVQGKVISLTAGMFLAFANMAESQQAQMKHLIAMLAPHLGGITHWEKDD